MMNALALAALLSQVPAPPAPPRAIAAAPDAPRAGVLRVTLPSSRTVGAIPPRVLAAFQLSLTKEVAKLQGVRATGPWEVPDLLTAQLHGAVRGCERDPVCLPRTAHAAGEHEFLSTEIALEGASYAVSLRRVPLPDEPATRTEARKVKTGDGSELLRLVGPAVQQLYPERGLKEGRVRGVERDAYQRLNPPPIPRWAFWTTAGAAVAAGVAGATYGLMAEDARSQYRSLAALSQTTPVSGAELVALEDRMSSQSSTANIFFVAAGVLGVTACMEAFYTDWHGYRAELRVQATPGGAAVGAGGRF
ncbi:MAG TPA: hypothetical protein VFL83_22525 [Anaeromyxobacter sp.]|nr:hypothetical protein [Anaeromyxobacter sp.]